MREPPYLTLGGSADLDHFGAHLYEPDDTDSDTRFDTESVAVVETLKAVLRGEDVPVRLR